MTIGPIADELSKRPVEAGGPEDLLAQQRQAERRFEVVEGMAQALRHLIGTREQGR